MRLTTLAAMLSTLCLTACGPRPEHWTAALPDRARLADCPQVFPTPPVLPALSPIVLPDGRQAVLLDVVHKRDRAIADYIIDGGEAWHRCASPVAYVIDWEDALTRQLAK